MPAPFQLVSLKEALGDALGAVAETIEHHRNELAFEAYVFEKAGSRPEDRPQYEFHARPHEEAIRKATEDARLTLLDMLADGRRVAIGRRHRDEPDLVIPSRYWPFLSADFDTNTASGDGLEYRAVKVLNPAQVPTDHPIIGQILSANTVEKKAPVIERRGRKKAADWDEYFRVLKAKIGAEGYPDENNSAGWCKQADVERFITGLVEEDHHSAAVATVRTHVKKFLERIRSEINS